MNLYFEKNAWEDYLFWQATDKKVLKKINTLIKECQRKPFEGIGKPEALKGNLSGYWSRRNTGDHRLVYSVQNDTLYIVQCRFHY
ncbi:MAG: Txe/YoeB family addiction module toxin [Marinifilaceae bacterium]